MAGEIEFTRNYSDLSTDNGFQFEFFCDRCGNGYRTEFDTFGLSCDQRLDSASGCWRRFGRATQRAKSAAWEKASDKALRTDPAEVRPVPALQRVDVPRPLLEREERPLQAVRPDPAWRWRPPRRAGLWRRWAHAKMAEEPRIPPRLTGVRASRPRPMRGAPQATNAKFCPVQSRPCVRHYRSAASSWCRGPSSARLRRRRPHESDGDSRNSRRSAWCHSGSCEYRSLIIYLSPLRGTTMAAGGDAPSGRGHRE